jgi:hypothetical protein
MLLNNVTVITYAQRGHGNMPSEEDNSQSPRQEIFPLLKETEGSSPFSPMVPILS